MATDRPKRRIPRPDYRIMADITVPKRTCSQQRAPKTGTQAHKNPTQLFRLQVIDEDNELVKVHYVGYGNEFDEWRSKSDVVDLNEDSLEVSETTASPQEVIGAVLKPFSLYEELTYRIKSLLWSSRKGDPICCVSMSFDTIHFDGLIRRGTLVKGQSSEYTVTTLTKLDDILGQRWYIRGINEAGDFCYVKPGTVRYRLRFVKGQADFQVLEDGTLHEYTCGQRHQLIFKFIRLDSILSQWHNAIELCKK